MPDLATASNAELWQYGIGIVSPLVLSLILQSNWDSRLQSIVTVIYCIIVGTGTLLFGGQLTGLSVATAGLRIFFMAIVTYYGFWKPTGIAPALKVATTPRALPPST